ncbi:thiamine diphosphokinase, partial [uncultured Lactobacillus sp.]|uniref:thiamine diphosphokinase n=1 Tax=uncultured Lactobacillus sp. TaxID=153152 RepID=UPI002623CE98
MKAAVLLGGPKDFWPEDLKNRLLKAKQKGAMIAASDRGSLYLHELGLKCDLAVGDFDSLKKDELAIVESKVSDIRYSHPIKDFTDSEQLFWTLFNDYQIKYLEVYGATGGRLDHFFVNLFTFLHEPLSKFKDQVRIIDAQNEILFLSPGKNILQFKDNYQYFGVGASGAIYNLSIKNARYDLNNYSSNNPIMFSSNEFVEDTAVEIS